MSQPVRRSPSLAVRAVPGLSKPTLGFKVLFTPLRLLNPIFCDLVLLPRGLPGRLFGSLGAGD